MAHLGHEQRLSIDGTIHRPLPHHLESVIVDVGRRESGLNDKVCNATCSVST